MTDDEDDETAYLVLPDSPKRTDRNYGQALVPRERTISSQGEFPKQQVAGDDDDITCIEVIVNDIQPHTATLSFSENNRRTPHEIKEDQRSHRNSDVYERTTDDHSHLPPKVHHQIKQNDSKDVVLESCLGNSQTDDPVASADRLRYAKLETVTRINSETLKIERHRGSVVVEEVDEAGNVDAGMKQRSFHHGNFLRYKYPTQFHRPDSAPSHVVQKQLRDRLPASLRPNFRYGKEPQLQSTRSSSQRSGKGRGTAGKFPEYPARLRDVGIECEILRIVEKANKCHQVAPETANAMTQNSVDIRDSSSQHVIQSEDKEVQTKTKVLQDTCTQVRPETKNRMVETSVRILFYPEVLTQNSWTQCEETSDCWESQYSRSGLVGGRKRPMLAHMASLGGEVGSARSFCDTVLEEETEPTDYESRKFEPELFDPRTRDQHDSNRFESRRSDSRQSEIKQSISVRSDSMTSRQFELERPDSRQSDSRRSDSMSLRQCQLERPGSRQSDARQSESRKSESRKSESRISDSRRPDSRQYESKISQSTRPESRQSQSNRPESGQSQSNRSKSGQSQSNRPKSGQSQSNRPESGQSQSNRPESRQSQSNRPESGQSQSNQPESRQSQSNRPESIQSQSNQPESRQSQSNRPESGQSQSNRPESGQSQSNRPESRQSQSNRPESRQSQSNQPESRQSQSNQPESRQSQSNRPESRQSQSNRPESRQSQSNRPESSKSQSNRPESGQSQSNRSDSRQSQSNRPESRQSQSNQPESGQSQSYRPDSRRAELRQTEVRQDESMKCDTRSVGSRYSEFDVSYGSQFSLVSGFVSGFDAEDRYREAEKTEKKKGHYADGEEKNPHEEEEKEEEVVEEEDQLDYDDDFDEA